MEELKKQIEDLKIALSSKHTPEFTRSMIRKKLEQLESQLEDNNTIEIPTSNNKYKELCQSSNDDYNYFVSYDENTVVITPFYKGTGQQGVLKTLYISDIENYNDINEKLHKCIISNLKKKGLLKSDYKKEVERQKEQGLIDDDTEGISILGMTQGKDNPVSKFKEQDPKTVSSFDYKMKNVKQEEKTSNKIIQFRYDNKNIYDVSVIPSEYPVIYYSLRIGAKKRYYMYVYNQMNLDKLFHQFKILLKDTNITFNEFVDAFDLADLRNKKEYVKQETIFDYITEFAEENGAKIIEIQPDDPSVGISNGYICFEYEGKYYENDYNNFVFRMEKGLGFGKILEDATETDEDGTPFTKEVSLTKKPDITAQYENKYYLNKAIEQLIDWNIENNKGKFSLDELKFIETYTGYGGLQHITTKLKVREKGIMTEYYTPDKLIETMWALAYKHGFKDGGHILENSVGIGRFLKYAPASSEIDAYEINRYSYLICKILYPNVDIRNIPYEQNFVDNSNNSIKKNVVAKYDLVIGNPPYGDFKSQYSATETKYTKANNLTEYFITRSLDELKSGGLLVYVIGTSIENGGTPFLDSSINECKKAISSKADLIDAYRLGNNIFEGTGVLADIVVFKKK